MRFGEIAARLSGFSTPIFGLQWEPPIIDRDVARRVVAYLEDRRVLYDLYQAETPEWCVKSVLEMRAFLTEVLGQGRIADELVESLRAMRAACRKFLGSIPFDEDGKPLADIRDLMWGMEGWQFNQALGALRGVFGIHVAQLAVKYGIDVEEPS